MEQLDLFAIILGEDSAQAGRPAASDDVPDAGAAPAEGQLGLFSEPWQRVVAAHRAFADFDLDGALAALNAALRAYPGDKRLRERAGRVSRLARLLDDERVRSGSLAAGLLAVEADVPAFLQDAWHGRLAAAIEAEGGAGAVRDGEHAGLHYRLAGDLARAEKSLRAALARDPGDCRARGYLADTLVLRGRVHPGRIEYRDALAQRPADVDWARLAGADRDVADLPSLAELDYEVAGDPLPWAAAVGITEGLFVPPLAAPERAEAPLSAGLQFYDWIAREATATTDADRLAARRAMKTLAPALFAQYLARRHG